MFYLDGYLCDNDDDVWLWYEAIKGFEQFLESVHKYLYTSEHPIWAISSFAAIMIKSQLAKLSELMESGVS